MTSRRRFWLVYGSSWLAFLGLMVLVFLSSGIGIRPAVLTSLFTVLPESMAGLVVLELCRRWPWPGAPRIGFFASHVGAALAYGVLCSAAMNLLFAAHRYATEGIFRPRYFEVSLIVWQVFIASLLYAVMASTAYTVDLVRRLREEELRAERALALKSRAELRALRARLNPHFLFNTLHTLLVLVRRDPGAAEDALEQLGGLLHYVVGVEEAGDEVPLRSEWEFARNYLALETLRLGPRLQLDCRIDPEALDVRVPAFCLQPLLENAVRHAIAPRPEGGTLAIVVERRGEELWLSVANETRGEAGDASTHGTGLRLLRERLSAIYGDAARLGVNVDGGGRFVVSMVLPARARPESETAA
jgi:signal transduction histidine kinase